MKTSKANQRGVNIPLANGDHRIRSFFSSSIEVALLIRNAANNGKLRVLIAPSGVKVLSRRSARSLTALNDTNYSRNSTIRSKYDDQYSSSSVDRYRSSSSRRPDERNYQHRSTTNRNSNQHLSEPSEPLPRRINFSLTKHVYRSITFR